MNTMDPQHMTEKELRAEVARISELLRGGDATSADAARFDQCKRNLRLIQGVRAQRPTPDSWPQSSVTLARQDHSRAKTDSMEGTTI